MNEDVIVKEMRQRGYSEELITALIEQHKRSGMPTPSVERIINGLDKKFINEAFEQVLKKLINLGDDQIRPIPAVG